MYTRSTKSDIGNIYEILNALRRHHQSDLNQYGGSGIFGERYHSSVRELVFRLLNYKPVDTPLNPVSRFAGDREGYSEEEIEFDVSKGIRARGTLLIPQKGSPPYPAIVAMHDHSGLYYYGREKIIQQPDENPVLTSFKEACYGGRSWASELAKRGYILFSIDAFYFGSRKIDLHVVSDEIIQRCPYKLEGLKPGSAGYIDRYNNICAFLEALVVKHIFISGTTWPAILLNDDKRSVDYLCTREEVDRTKIGCCGLSIGGFRTAMLSAMDTRISCAVVAGWVSTFESMLYDGLRDHTYMLYIPGLTRWMDYPDIVGLIAPRPLLVQQCAKDDLFSMEGMEKACRVIEDKFVGMHEKSKYRYHFYDNGHQFNIKMQEDAFSWFDRWLKEPGCSG